MPKTVIVVPCFNEEKRLNLAAFSEFFAEPKVELLFVDDGSTDDTLDVLTSFAKTQLRATTLVLPKNCGKAEAVRAGLCAALDAGADIVGYIDADLATPVAEVLRLLKHLQATGVDGVIGARVAHLGANIRRSRTRHYLGRVFATLTSLALREEIYDTQCGAKLFVRSDALAQALAAPFTSRWAFDVELLGRLLARDCLLEEVPLRQWEDVKGSKMSVLSMARAGMDLGRIAIALRRKRR